MSVEAHLPAVLREIAEVAGLDAALRIAQLRGGARLSIPSRIDEDSWLAREIGLEAARKLSRHYTSGRTAAEIVVPLGPTGARAAMAAAIRRLLAQGVSGEEIARRLRIASRTVTRHKSRDRADLDSRQGKLF